MATTLTIPGRRDESLEQVDLGIGKFGDVLRGVRVSAAARLEAGRAAGEEPIRIEADDDDVVELHLEGGVRQWLSVAQLREDLGEQVTRGAAAGELVLPAELRLGEPSRGASAWALDALRVLKVDLASIAAQEIARRLEAQLEPGPGLYRCPDPTALGRETVEASDIPTDRPVLLLLHGTASRTGGSFGALAEPRQRERWQGLVERYGGQILAFEHATLSQSPLENAVELMEHLPVGARLHLVSHSRGGLVGELLCRGWMTGGRPPFDAAERAVFKDEGDDGPALDRSRDRAALERLAELLAAKRPRVERFVRTACPARGTTLASRRLDRYLSAMVNLVGLVPGLRESVLYDFMTSLLLAVAKKRTEPTELPGLEAMMPGSPLIRVLNRPGVEAEADLSVIAGDLAGEGLLGRLKTFATDLFYREDHDLVVPTAAMYGGTGRSGGARFFFDRGPKVDHFSYFRNERTARKLVEGLGREDGTDAGFEPLAPPREILERSYQERSGVARPVVFVIPGIMGSHLAVAGERVWMDLGGLAQGGMERLGIEAPGVSAQTPVASAYLDLIEFLSTSHRVVPFPYDWRRSVLEEARRLGDAVDSALKETDQPVHLLAHSMGGLVARAMIAERPQVWRRLASDRGGRLLMLGTPNGGSYVVPRLLLGRERLVRLLALMDLKHTHESMLHILVRYPGLLEMLPAGGRHDFFDPRAWDELAEAQGNGWARPRPEDLQAAGKLRRLLDDPRRCPVDPEHMLYVAGMAPATPIDHRLDPTARGRRRIRFLATSDGDGRVPWSTGSLPGVRTWSMEATHGELAAHRPAFPALLELLESGSTGRLPTLPLVAARGRAATFELPDDEPERFPDAAELEGAAVGFEQRVVEGPAEEPIAVSVAHGDLAYAHHPVAVGHYEGDSLVGAEAYLDHCLDGRLAVRRRLGLYPGPVGTTEVILQPGKKPAGAVIVGLGRVGELTVGHLIDSFARAALTYALKRVELVEDPGSGAGGRRSATLTTLLIGTGEGGLSMDDALVAILQGAVRANQNLVEAELADRVHIDAIELLELYEDRAVQAAHALQHLARSAWLRGQIAVEPRLRVLKGGRRRVAYGEDQSWWRRLEIREKGDGSLAFTTLTDRARAEVSLVPARRALVDAFVADAVRRPQWQPELAATLFEQLVPNPLKERAPERRDLVLVVDAAAARYPWELLHDASQGETKPLAVQAGLVRQLLLEDYRERVVSPGAASALVVGDPPLDSQALPPLPAARREAELVAEELEAAGFSVTRRIGSDFKSIFGVLHGGYRVLHLAGHGVYEQVIDEKQVVDGKREKREKRQTGMVLGRNRKGELILLTPGEVEQMRQVPELVFINCCHLGRIDQPGEADRHDLAANLSSQFIKMGVRAVVAAGWAVHDQAAKTFARQLYGSLLAGERFGRAVLAARQATFQDHAGINTWGAYQCYGDPDYRLVSTAIPRRDQAEAPRLLSAAEVVVKLENLAQDAETASALGVAGLRARLGALEGTIQEAWRGDARLLAALGCAHGQLEQFQRAVECYEEALAVEKAALPVQSLEQLANLQARWSVELWKAQKKGEAVPRDPRGQIAEAIERLELLLRLGETAERLSLMGSARKRLAQISAGQECDQALDAMVEAYGKAHQRALAQDGEADPYPLLNWLAGRAVRRWRGRSTALKDFGRWLEQAERLAAERQRREPAFKTAILTPDCMMVRHLAGGDLPEHQGEIVEGYLGAWHRWGSPRELRSVREGLDAWADLLCAPGEELGAGSGRLTRKQALRLAQCEVLRSIRDRLTAAAG